MIEKIKTSSAGEDVSIIIGTYGDKDYWGCKALDAFESAANQSVLPKEIVWCHGDSLQEARNEGVRSTRGEWLIHLDADDSLDVNYVKGILEGTGDLRQPKTLGVYPDGREDSEAVFIPAKSGFDQGNWLVIGTGVRRKYFEATGGWGNEELYEDWAIFWKCWLKGAEIGRAPQSIYRVMVGEGRNLPDRMVQIFWFEKIANELKIIPRVKL